MAARRPCEKTRSDCWRANKCCITGDSAFHRQQLWREVDAWEKWSAACLLTVLARRCCSITKVMFATDPPLSPPAAQETEK
ncbi:hypothetical protein E2C01_089034 [Portunus trituberculatus]|uniref:Uncharacterized protein n=1 Tax=Portunus trituberculatus TaxID=210409 RepID=A0A5B7JG76_PORTR|nr:hypothetical protein [Portunus trituberculatus]